MFYRSQYFLMFLVMGAQLSLFAGMGNTKEAYSNEMVSLIGEQNKRNDLMAQRLCEAINNGNLQTVEHFLPLAEVNWQFGYTVKLGLITAMLNTTPLCMAAATGNLEIFTRLVEARADINNKITLTTWTTPMFETPLQTAAFLGHREIVKYLIEQGVAINVRSSSGETALSFAENRGHHEIAELLHNFSKEPTPDDLESDELKEIAKKRAENLSLKESN